MPALCLFTALVLGSLGAAAGTYFGRRAGGGLRAAQRADERRAAGDIEGRAAWLRILAAVEKLMATKALGPVH